MKVKVAKWGNSIAVRIPRDIADGAGLSPGTTVDLQRHGRKIEMVLEPAKIPSYRLEDLLAQIKPGTEPPPTEDWSGAEQPWPDDDWRGTGMTDDEWAAQKARWEAHRRGKS